MRGGLLCDEMGLGKTVMCIALFLAHPRPTHMPTPQPQFTIFPTTARTEDESEQQRDSTAPKEESKMALMGNGDHLQRSIRPASISPRVLSSPSTVAASPSTLTRAKLQHSGIDQRKSFGGDTSVEDRGAGSDDGEAELDDIPASSPSATQSKAADVVECFCGEAPDPSEQFVCCDRCNTWQHWRCVSYFPSSASASDEYVCPTCSAAGPPLPVKATLVCCPDVILGQWREEIARHCSKHRLKVLVYSGVRRADGGTAGNAIEKMRRKEEERRRREEREAHELARREKEKDASTPSSPVSGGDATALASPSPDRLQPVRTSSSGSIVSAAPISYRVVRPQQLAEYDVILTTFSVLRADLYHVSAASASGGSRPLRSRKRYRVMPSPLLSAQYWRVVLDEAQMMGEGITNSARMALLLPAANRWGVSGTVISKGLDDLYGLLLFLQAHPYSEHRYWDQFLSFPYLQRHPLVKEKLNAIVRRLMWRNTKLSVRDELALPPLITHLHSLSFTPVEAFYYSKREDECQRVSASVRSKKKSLQLSHSEQRSMLHSLLRLRQACDHHQLGASTGFVSLQKHTLSMKEMTSELKEDARLKGEEAQRLMFFAMNALGSLRMLRGEWTQAMQLYRQVLGLSVHMEDEDDQRWKKEVEEERGRAGKRVIQMDGSQEIHALYNLAEAASRAYGLTGAAVPPGLPPCSPPFSPIASASTSSLASSSSVSPPHSSSSLSSPTASPSAAVLSRTRSRVAFLYARVEMLKAKSLDRSNALFFAAQLRFQQVHDECEAQQSALTSSPSLAVWYSDAIDLVQSHPSNEPEAGLLRRVQAELADAQTGYDRKQQNDATSIVDQFRDLSGLRLIINNHLEGLDEARKRIIGRVTRMVAVQPPSAEAILRSVNCARCKQLKGPVCDGSVHSDHCADALARSSAPQSDSLCTCVCAALSVQVQV